MKKPVSQTNIYEKTFTTKRPDAWYDMCFKVYFYLPHFDIISTEHAQINPKICRLFEIKPSTQNMYIHYILFFEKNTVDLISKRWNESGDEYLPLVAILTIACEI